MSERVHRTAEDSPPRMSLSACSDIAGIGGEVRVRPMTFVTSFVGAFAFS